MVEFEYKFSLENFLLSFGGIIKISDMIRILLYMNCSDLIAISKYIHHEFGKKEKKKLILSYADLSNFVGCFPFPTNLC